MDTQKTQVVERLKQANNILVTVSNNPSVDQLAACIGLTLALNKMGKHATAVFSGSIPSTIEFLQPEKTLEKNTNSLQDFIIALDKSKADKLRYKVEDRVVKIFITPYRTSISDKDLEFSQGDFNVDVVVALGVHQQSDLDQAITSHGRILHDATVMSINVSVGPELGSINWVAPNVSSLSEQGVELINALDQKLIDGQIATAFLTGIVAETERFSNQKTTPQTMSLSAELMSQGANQQLVATQLEVPEAPLAPEPSRPLAETEKPGELNAMPPLPAAPMPVPPKPRDDGTIEITHDTPQSQPAPILPPVPPAPQKADEPDQQAPQIHIDDQGRLHPLDVKPAEPAFPEPSFKAEPPKPEVKEPELKKEAEPQLPPIEKELPKIKLEDSSRLMTEPPTFETPPLTANAEPEQEDRPTTDPLSLPQVGLLNREPLPSQKDRLAPGPLSPAATGPLPQSPLTGPAPSAFGNNNPMSAWGAGAPTSTPVSGPAPAATFPPAQTFSPTNPPANRTLSQIEADVKSPHLEPGFPVSDTMLPPNPIAANNVVSPSSAIMPPSPAPADLSAGHGPSVTDARDAVAQAINGAADRPLEPIQALNAQPLSAAPLHTDEQQIATAPGALPPAVPPQFAPPTMPLPNAAPMTSPSPSNLPPSTPPPMMPPAPGL